MLTTRAYQQWLNGEQRCGISQWRLPTMGELMSLMHYGSLAKDPDVRVQLQADDGVNYGEVARAMASIERAGITYSIVCASPAYVKANGAVNKPSDLLNHACLRQRADMTRIKQVIIIQKQQKRPCRAI